MVNLWQAYADELVPVFARANGRWSVETALRAIRQHVAARPLSVLDVGGGFGALAEALASDGHEVTVLDIDERALDLARARLAACSHSVRHRVRFLQGDGSLASDLVGSTSFDLTCCHSVLMYESDPAPLVGELVKVTRPGGWISITGVNPAAVAMRPALQRRWAVAVATLQSGRDVDPTCRPTVQHSREQLSRLLEHAGAPVEAWYGIGIFSDHLTEPQEVEAVREMIEAEWLAADLDPYRQVARCFHLMARRTGESVQTLVDI